MNPGVHPMNEVTKIDGRSVFLIQTEAALASMLSHITAETTLGIDTEADSLHQYRDRVCLIQVSDSHADWIVDPLSVGELDGLWEVFRSVAKVKILHGADFDLRSLNRDYGVRTANIFDTKTALELLGHSRVGLADILMEYFNIAISKKYQKHNWSRRPISPDAIAYASTDTRYLLPLAEILRDELERMNRMEWARQEFKHLETIRWQPSKRELLGFRRLISDRNPDPLYVECTKTLFEVREQQAERNNLPVFRIFSDAVLTETAKCIAGKKRIDDSILAKIEPGYRSVVRSVIGDLLQGRMQRVTVPFHFYESRDVPVDPVLYRKLQMARNKAASDYRVDPAVIAGNKVLKKVADQPSVDLKDYEAVTRISEMRRWQWELVTRALE